MAASENFASIAGIVGWRGYADSALGVVEKTGSVFGFVGHYHDIDGLSEHTAGSL